MTELRWPSVPAAATAVLAAAASYFTLLSWDGLSDDASSYLVPLFFICVGVAALGLGLRAVHMPRPLVPLIQLLVVGLLLHRWLAPDAPGAGLFPTGDSLATAAETLRRSIDAAGRYAAPIPGTETQQFAPIMVVIGATVTVCVDTLACTARRVPLAGLPLLAVYTAPVAILGGVSWAIFGVAAACFLLMLAAERVEVMSSWVRPPMGGEKTALAGSRPQAPQLGPQWTKTSRLGVLGIGAAVVAPVLLPAGDGILGGYDWSGGTAGADSEVRLENPLVDVKRDLVRGKDIALVEVRTDDPDPSYLRLTVLDEFDGATWRPAERDLPSQNRAAGEVPTAGGLEGTTPRQQFEWNVRVLEAFNTAWLPTPFPYSAVDVDGDWRFDTDTMDLTSPGRPPDGAGVEYGVTGLELTPDQQTLVSAPLAPANIRSEYTALPSSLPTEFTELADKLTAGAQSSFARAVTLQDWFREDGGFRYSLERAEGNGIEQLALFLGTGPGSRVGYCEQFASAMAMMARSLDIPARVAVGFLKPEKVGDYYVYSSHDLHAWPELYFQGVGWLRFEPTPARRARDVPDYTNGAAPASQSLPTPSERPSVAPPPPRTQEAPEPVRDPAPEAATPTSAGRFGWLAGAAVFAGLLCAPRLMRSRLQKRRMHPTGASTAEDAWVEVRATALDLRHDWDDGATLRCRARDLIPAMGTADDSDAVRALWSLVLLLERSRYSRDGEDAERSAEAQRLARSVIQAMTATADPGQRRRATWLPWSLWQGSRALQRSAMPKYMTADNGTAVVSQKREGISV